MTDADDERFAQLSEMVTDAADQLGAAQDHLERIHDSAFDIASILFPLGPDRAQERP